LDLVSFLGFGAFALASFAVGGRLLLLARRTQQVPEFAIGIALFANGALGYGLVVLGFVLRPFSPFVNSIFLLSGIFLINLGCAALALGVWRIFRPCDAWARWLYIGISASLLAAFALRALDPTRMPAAPHVFWTFSGVSGLCFAWSGFESLRYGALMRRRMRLGLADPAVVARFYLWGAASLAAAAIYASSMLNRMLAPATILPAILRFQSLLGLAAAVAIWLAFFPPRALRERAPVAGHTVGG
jgi:hypothetical protein